MSKAKKKPEKELTFAEITVFSSPVGESDSQRWRCSVLKGLFVPRRGSSGKYLAWQIQKRSVRPP